MTSDDTRLYPDLADACAKADVDSTGARLLHNYSNVIFHLPVANAVARITVGPGDVDRVRQTQAVVRWLVQDHDFPAPSPLDGTEPVRTSSGAVASFWDFHRQPDAPSYTSVQLAELLRHLHDVAIGLPEGTPRWEALASLDTALRDEASAGVLPAEEIGWLIEQIQQTREELEAVDWELPVGIIHGDAWLGNLLTSRSDRVMFGDWDWTSVGPREIDLVPTWHATRRYGRDANWTSAFARTYGYDLQSSPGFLAIMRMRDFMQLTGPLRRSPSDPRYLRALRQRLEAIRSGDHISSWVAL